MALERDSPAWSTLVQTVKVEGVTEDPNLGDWSTAGG
jgi:hypothetical protein